MYERTRLSFLTGVIAAVALSAGTAVIPVRAADEDPNLARLAIPCYQALRAEESVRPRVYAHSPGLAGAHQTIVNALKTNSRCSSTLSPMASMHLANDAFLWSLLAEDEQLLGSSTWHHSLDVADSLLSQCIVAPDLIKSGVSSRCQNQRSFNIAFAREPYGNDPCFRAQQAETTASDLLSGTNIDQARTQAGFKAANDGLAAADKCQSPPMKLVDQAYLLSLRGEAEHDLDIPGWDHTFRDANDLLTRCATTLGRLPGNVSRNCTIQHNSNDQLVQEYRDEANAPPGQTTPVNYTALPWPYPVRAGFNPDQLSTNDPFAKTVDYDTFAAIGSVDDLTKMFDFGAAGAPSNMDAKFFRANMLLIAVSHKHDQQCTSQAQDVHQFVPQTAVGAGGTLPVVVVDYSLSCQPPAGPATPVTLALQIARSGGQVQFIENGIHHRSRYYLPAPPRR
ncbi:MAG TPA: hypothetical protein VHT05_05700 [Candidatus Elarobacter sp.]|nr:hypothetical protein [Candidatus Elarobacter sp.]